jgi:hypothetical protein
LPFCRHEDTKTRRQQEVLTTNQHELSRNYFVAEPGVAKRGGVWLAPKPGSGFTYFQFFTRRQACGLTGLVVTTNVFDFLFELFVSETETLVETARPYPLY